MMFLLVAEITMVSLIGHLHVHIRNTRVHCCGLFAELNSDVSSVDRSIDECSRECKGDEASCSYFCAARASGDSGEMLLILLRGSSFSSR